jgi:DNA-binding beta-propeller fold protein YncE
MDVAVNPATGQITVVGTEASNEIRFEPVLKGVFVQVKLALVSSDAATKSIMDLILTLITRPRASFSPAKRSLGDPRGIVWNSAGTRAYVAGMGSNNILILDQAGRPVEPDPVIEVEEGPSVWHLMSRVIGCTCSTASQFYLGDRCREVYGRRYRQDV